jgi:hypothetical protein
VTWPDSTANTSSRSGSASLYGRLLIQTYWVPVNTVSTTEWAPGGNTETIIEGILQDRSSNIQGAPIPRLTGPFTHGILEKHSGHLFSSNQDRHSGAVFAPFGLFISCFEAVGCQGGCWWPLRRSLDSTTNAAIVGFFFSLTSTPSICRSSHAATLAPLPWLVHMSSAAATCCSLDLRSQVRIIEFGMSQRRIQGRKYYAYFLRNTCLLSTRYLLYVDYVREQYLGPANDTRILGPQKSGTTPSLRARSSLQAAVALCCLADGHHPFSLQEPASTAQYLASAIHMTKTGIVGTLSHESINSINQSNQQNSAPSCCE